MDITDKVKALVAALLGQGQQPQRPMPPPLPQIPQNGLANRAQQILQNRGSQLDRQIAEQGG
jgi:hypothetical protein